MAYQIIVTTLAERDLESIRDFIAKDNPDAADTFCLELIHEAKTLRQFPHRVAVFRKNSEIRKLPYRSYLIFYRLNEKTNTVYILRFWHGARDRRRLRLKEESAAYAQAVLPVS